MKKFNSLDTIISPRITEKAIVTLKKGQSIDLSTGV